MLSSSSQGSLSLKVAEDIVIDSAKKGLRIGPCEEYLDRRRPKTEHELFEIMQEYSESDRDHARCLEELEA